MLSFSVVILDHFQLLVLLTQRWRSWLSPTALAWSASSGLACWETLAWGWGASASSLWQSCVRSWRWRRAAAWPAGSTACGKRCAPGCSPRWQILHRRSSPVFLQAKGPAGSRPASGAAGPTYWPAGLLAYWRRQHEQPAGATDRSDRSCGGLSPSTPAPLHRPTGWSRSHGRVDWCHYRSTGKKRGNWLKHKPAHVLRKTSKHFLLSTEIKRLRAN